LEEGKIGSKYEKSKFEKNPSSIPTYIDIAKGYLNFAI